MIIREMTMDDIPELAELYKQFWGEESCVEKMRQQFRELEKKGTHILLSAVDEEGLLGSVTGIVCQELYGDCRPFLVLENMVVDKRSRQKGIGKALIAELERLARERGCTQIILVTEADRRDACGFYESAGFHPTAHKGYKKKI